MNYICLWGILASITGIAIMFSVIKHKKSVSAIKSGTYLIFSILMICLGITTILSDFEVTNCQPFLLLHSALICFLGISSMLQNVLKFVVLSLTSAIVTESI